MSQNLPKIILDYDLIQDDIDLLTTHYNAICKIRKTLDSIANKYNYSTGFEVWPTPNPYYDRTYKHLILESSTVRDNPDRINKLYTPFGKVELMSGGLVSKMDKISDEFMEKMDWEIEKINTLKCYNYDQKNKIAYGPFPPKTESWEGACDQVQYYLVKKVGIFNLPINGDLIKLNDFYLDGKQYDIDQAVFKKVSNGKRCF